MAGFNTENLLISTVSNYQGDLIIEENLQNPFTTYLGVRDELTQTSFQETGAMKFPMSQTHSLDAASQPAVTENQIIAAIDAETNEGDQVVNYCQVFTKAVNASPLKLADRSISGVAVDEMDLLMQVFGPQIALQMLQIKRNYEYSCLNGTGQDSAGDPDVAFKINGILNAAGIVNVNGTGAAISVALIDQMIQEMADAGASFENIQVHTTMKLKQAIGKLFGLPPRDRTLGGINITRISTDAGEFDLVFNPKIPANTVGCFDMKYCKLRANTIPGSVPFGLYDIASASMAQKKQFYGALGIDYGSGVKHGKLTNVVEK